MCLLTLNYYFCSCYIDISNGATKYQTIDKFILNFTKISIHNCLFEHNEIVDCKPLKCISETLKNEVIL